MNEWDKQKIFQEGEEFGFREGFQKGKLEERGNTKKIVNDILNNIANNLHFTKEELDCAVDIRDLHFKQLQKQTSEEKQDENI